MYLPILGKPTDADLERYPAVHLTGPHEWYPSVLDYTHPTGYGEPPWYCEDPNFVISVAYKIQFRSKVNQLLLELDTSSPVAFKNC